MSSKRTLFWLAAMGLILAFGQVKAVENSRYRARFEAWRRLMDRYEIESRQEAGRISDFLQSLSGKSDARDLIEERFSDGEPLHFKQVGQHQEATWQHPLYGIVVTASLQGDHLVGTGVSYGTGQLQAVHPPPPQFPTDTPAESLRQRIPKPGGVLWIVCLAVAAISARYRRAASEGMAALAIFVGTAWLVSPLYSLTPQGVFVNDPLFFAAVMIVVSVIMAAWNQPAHGRILQFDLLSLLAVMGGVAVLLALGPLGYVATAVLASACVIFALTLALRRRFLPPRQPSPPGGGGRRI